MPPHTIWFLDTLKSSCQYSAVGIELSTNYGFKMNNCNFLRFILAFIVLLGHLIIITNHTELSYFKGYFNTYISVTGFFCISGYLIGKSFSETSSLKLYFTKRAARILPAYIFVVILSALLLSPLSTLSFSNYFTSIDLYKYLIANLFFLNFLHPDLPGIFTSPQLTSHDNERY